MKNFLNIHDAILLLTLVQCLFLIGLVNTFTTNNKQSRQLLSIFFILSAAWIVSTLLSWNDELKTTWLNSTLFSPLLISMSLLLQGPCLYFYFRSLYEDIRFRQTIHLLHLIPVALASLAIIIFNVDGEAWVLKTVISQEKETATRFAWTLIRCVPVIYVFFCFKVIRQLREKLSQTYSSASVVEFKLAYFVLLGFSAHWLWAFFQYLAGNYLSDSLNYWAGNFEDLLIVIQVNGLLFLGIKNTRELLNTNQSEIELPKLQEQTLDKSKIDLIETAIHDKKLYLENNINLDRFAELTGMKSREVSFVLHEHYKLNFFEFINGFRLNEAKRLLASQECADLSILDIIYKSGFNSQSAFQRYFKRVVGCTPTEYRRNSDSQPHDTTGLETDSVSS